jgi:tetratricopeptide (TPR) repeat protein
VVPALVAVAALAAAGVTVALTTGDEDSPTRSAAGTTTAPARTTPARTTAARTTTTRTTTTRSASPTATTPAPPRTQTAPAPAPADGRSPAQLNDAGFALIRQTRYAEAVPLLQAAVERHRAAGSTTGLPYAYALYNLAYALARVGRQAEAIPLLEERLRVSDNQRGVVRRELRRIQGGTD